MNNIMVYKRSAEKTTRIVYINMICVLSFLLLFVVIVVEC